MDAHQTDAHPPSQRALLPSTDATFSSSTGGARRRERQRHYLTPVDLPTYPCQTYVQPRGPWIPPPQLSAPNAQTGYC